MRAHFLEANTYRAILRAEYENRSARNARYSLRAFARDLSLKPSHLTQILKNTKGLSKSAALEVAKGLTTNPLEARIFSLLVDASRLTRGEKLTALKLELAGLRSEINVKLQPLEVVERFQTTWVHYALLELIKNEGVAWKVQTLAAALEIPDEVVRVEIDKLVKLGRIKMQFGAYQAADEHSRYGTDTSSEAIRTLHKQFIVKANLAIDNQDVSERTLSANVVGVKRADYAKAKEKIDRFTREFCLEFGSGGDKDAVYCMNIQFFNLVPGFKGSK
ncbi:MAG TPA: TIGR02147 family protein [Bdellovibrionales bacterium]|nr:TIGR02147 family protein [Bdellovibrionales bacterium]